MQFERLLAKACWPVGFSHDEIELIRWQSMHEEDCKKCKDV